jgi:antitoxin component YwqK of YwqJK toxin-antitoxin module
MRHGQWKSYYPDGTVSFEGKFIDDNPNGKHTWYWPNGNKKTEGSYIMGLKDGEWIKYSSDGKTFISIYYKNGIEKRYDGVKVKIYDEDDSPVVPEDDY